MRSNKRKNNELRKFEVLHNFTKYAEGSVLISCGETRVLCNVSIIKGVPRFLQNSNQGWITAEYSMLPRATHSRTIREVNKGKQTGRTQEIQRLIGRSLRSCINLEKINGYTINIDCDVLQADGGTRTTSITGSFIALQDAINKMIELNILSQNPLKYKIAAISVGINKENEIILDLDYNEDSNAETDLNIIMTDQGKIIEIQGTAEGNPFSYDELLNMISTAKNGILEIFKQNL